MPDRHTTLDSKSPADILDLACQHSVSLKLLGKDRVSMPLQEEIDSMRKEIRTDSYAMSIGEWISLYQDNEVDIHPEFQRFFRWTHGQKTRLIESILLGIPIPPVFVSQREDGVWDVVDGLQRLSSIFQFVGVLRGENDEILEPLVLEGTKYLPSLDGKKWEDLYDMDNSFTSAQRLYIKRAKIDVTMIQKESPLIAKYELFQRLNTGGSLATPQEVRNCIMVMYNRDMYQWVRDLSQLEVFKECVALTDRSIDEQYDLELVLRFIVFRTLSESGLREVKDVGPFMTDRMVEIAQSKTFNFEAEAEAFKTTFELLYNTLKGNSFRKYDPVRGKFIGGFLVSPYEAVALGIGYNYKALAQADVDIEERVKAVWSNDVYKQWSGSGITAGRRIPKIIPLGRQIFKP